jgi:hypothetical protein
MIPALQSFLSLLSLKLTGKERISHVMDVCADPGFALFAGINVLPKTTVTSHAQCPGSFHEDWHDCGWG